MIHFMTHFCCFYLIITVLITGHQVEFPTQTNSKLCVYNHYYSFFFHPSRLIYKNISQLPQSPLNPLSFNLIANLKSCQSHKSDSYSRSPAVTTPHINCYILTVMLFSINENKEKYNLFGVAYDGRNQELLIYSHSIMNLSLWSGTAFCFVLANYFI